jgi:hypothetical protein
VLGVLGDWTGCGAVGFGFEPCGSVVPLPLPLEVPLPLPLEVPLPLPLEVPLPLPLPVPLPLPLRLEVPPALPLPAGEGEAVLTARVD